MTGISGAQSVWRNRMNRGQFVRTAGVGVAGLAAAGLGISRVANAKPVTLGLVPEWTEKNPFGYNWGVGKYFISMGLNPPTAPFCPAPTPLLECPLTWPGGAWDSILSEVNGVTRTTGRISRRVLNNNTEEITARINVQNGPLTIFRFDEFMKFRKGILSKQPAPILGATYVGGDITDGASYDYHDGSINYTLLAKFINPEPNLSIEFILDYKFGRVPGGRHEALAIQGTGTGTFTDYARFFGYTPGSFGTVHLPGTKAVGKQFYYGGEEIVIDESEVDIF